MTKKESLKKILIVGGGGRCHAIADAFRRSHHVGAIYCAPGNAGTAEIAENVDISPVDIEALADFASTRGIDLTVAGPEGTLCAGIADWFAARGLRLFGPTRAAARIETSKIFAKEIMRRAGVPTASYEAFSEYAPAAEYVKAHPLPVAIKYDGLASGKGVTVAYTLDEALEALRQMLVDREFGPERVLVEDYLEGQEFSFMCMVNGMKIYPLAVAQDHKRAYDGDKGPNTGGMGAYSPVPFVTPEVEERALREIMRPVAEALYDEGSPFLGVLYGGLILTAEGPKVVEFNARFGDPETEVVLPRLESDFYELVEAVMAGRDFTPRWSDEACLGIVLAGKGYPNINSQFTIHNSELRLAHDAIQNSELEGVVYHMGTRREKDSLVAVGGRVLMTVGKAENLTKARQHALAAIEAIATDNFFYRKDIGKGIILDGKRLAADIKDEIRREIEEAAKAGKRPPGLALVLVGDDPGSESYVDGKARDAIEVGIKPVKIKLPAEITEKELLQRIALLNADPGIDGIMVQLPLPPHIDENRVIAEIDPRKDVDGFHPENVAELWKGEKGGKGIKGEKGLVACTPRGIMRLLEANDIRIEGKRAVVVGRSNIVGLPVAKLLLDRNATVTIVHSMTPDIGKVTRQADILIVAAGQHSLITGDMIKPGAVVIDVGINRNEVTGKLQGDTVFESCRPVASAITPVPGGVGPLTKASLMTNTLKAWKIRV